MCSQITTWILGGVSYLSVSMHQVRSSIGSCTRQARTGRHIVGVTALARSSWDAVTAGRGISTPHHNLAQLWAKSYVPNLEALEVVGRLRTAGLRVGIFMNSDEFRHRYIEDTFRLSGSMDFVGSSHMFGATKPDRVAFERLASHFGFDPARALYIDDKASNAQACASAGMRGLYCPVPSQLGPLLAEQHGL